MRPFTFGEFLGAKLGLLPFPVYDTFHAVLLGRTVAEALDLGVFDALGASPASADELAGALRLPAESARLLLATLEASGYLTRKSDRYCLTRPSRRWLSSSSPEYLGNFLRYVALLHRKWLDLGETLRTGHPRRHYVETFSQDEWRIYVLGMYDLARFLLPSVLRAISLPPGSASLLDVGGSHGAYTRAFCERHAKLRGTILDVPPALETARELMRDSPAASRITFTAADVTRDDLPGAAYDAVLLFNMVHGFTPEQNAAIVRRLAGALAPGGRLYILDQFRENRARGTRRLLPLLVGLNLMNEAGGTAYGRGAVERWCSDAGLRLERSVRLGVPGVGFIVGARSKLTGG